MNEMETLSCKTCKTEEMIIHRIGERMWSDCAKCGQETLVFIEAQNPVMISNAPTTGGIKQVLMN